MEAEIWKSHRTLMAMTMKKITPIIVLMPFHEDLID
jgi:hypothetical protein